MTLPNAELYKDYSILKMETEDSEIKSFLFSLGCFSGEKITVISKKKNSLVIAVKDGRYSIDTNLAMSIKVGEIIADEEC